MCLTLFSSSSSSGYYLLIIIMTIVTTSNPRITFSSVTSETIPQLMDLHARVFPVQYGEKFYNEVLHSEELAKIIYYDNQCAGAICCRLESNKYSNFTARIYMMTLGVLKLYRNLGLGSMLIEHIMEYARKTTNPMITSIYLHVQTVNEKAIRFYMRNGFRIHSFVPDYYRFIENRDAYILSRPVFHLYEGNSKT
ncbi:acyl-CoA N-acyltransferase [Cokeromyces recurvatus]|uniref:acyl-CoA N-acyltransferase n=1 Tax=Cokeromyces recurvatus TaxID=90255 RepID=UPI0022205332|nr:acyl-CoA N-acyltransferase [Cokeromyces recurvatus]KAI7901717.1 acyl-CoA N-acyltransferase [Cokeromyces recurvatus]